MEDREKITEQDIIIDAYSTDVEALVDDLPSADESNLKPNLISDNEPMPFDPLGTVVSGVVEVNDELDSITEAATAKNETPTPESVAAELKEVASHATAADDEPEEEPEIIVAPTPEKMTKRKILPVVIAAVLTGLVVIIVCIVIKAQTRTEANTNDEIGVVDNRPKTTTYDYVVGAWESQAEGGSCYVLSEGKTFYWLRDCENYEDNYYYGDVASVLRGEDALKSFKMSFADVKKMLKIDDEKITKDDVFLISLKATERMISGVDTSATLGADPITLLFVRHGSSSKAYGYQLNSGDMYIFAYSSELVL